MKSVRYIMLFLGAFLAHHAVFGQSTSNSLDSTAALTYWYQPSFVIMHDMAIRNRVWIPEEIKNRSSLFGIRHSRGQGDFKAAQGTDGLIQSQLYTEGKTDWRKTSFWGRFSYDRSAEDSTALRHQSRWNVDAPLYFGSLRKNKYSRETYKLNAGIQRAFFDAKLPISLGIDYRLGSHYSNNDPRGDIKDMNLQFELSVGHNLPTLSYHIAGIWGYGSERVNVGYKNDKYTTNTEDPLYVNWMMNGFGSASERLKEINYNDIIHRKGVGAHILLKPNDRNKIYFNSRYLNEEQSFRRNDNSKQTYLSLNDYKKDIGSIDFLWSRQMHRKRLLTLALQGQIDFNYSYLANNYTYRRHEISFKTQLAVHQYLFEGHAGMYKTEKKDGVSGNQMEFDQVKLGLGLNRTFRLGQSADIIGTIGYTKQWSPSHNLYVSELNTGDFGKQILYQDYLYDTAPRNSWNMSWVWGTHHAKNNWSIQLQMDYQCRGNLVPIDYTLSSVPGKNWFLGKLGVSYIF
mgnify:FL=1